MLHNISRMRRASRQPASGVGLRRASLEHARDQRVFEARNVVYVFDPGS